MRFGPDFLGAVLEGLTSLFGVLEELFSGLDEGVDHGVDLWGSETLLERMLEKAMGFAVLGALGSSFARV